MAKYRISRYWKTYKNPVTGKEEFGDGSYIDELAGGHSEYVIEKKMLLTTLFGNTWGWGLSTFNVTNLYVLLRRSWKELLKESVKQKE